MKDHHGLKKIGAAALNGEWSSIISGRYGTMYVERVAMVTKHTVSAILPPFCSLFRFFFSSLFHLIPEKSWL